LRKRGLRRKEAFTRGEHAKKTTCPMPGPLEERTSSEPPNGRAKTEPELLRCPRRKSWPRLLTSASTLQGADLREVEAPASDGNPGRNCGESSRRSCRDRGAGRGCSDEPIPSPLSGQRPRKTPADRLRRITSVIVSGGPDLPLGRGGSWPRCDFCQPSGGTRLLSGPFSLWVPPPPGNTGRSVLVVVNADQTTIESAGREASVLNASHRPWACWPIAGSPGHGPKSSHASLAGLVNRATRPESMKAWISASSGLSLAKSRLPPRLRLQTPAHAHPVPRSGSAAYPWARSRWRCSRTLRRLAARRGFAWALSSVGEPSRVGFGFHEQRQRWVTCHGKTGVARRAASAEIRLQAE